MVSALLGSPAVERLRAILSANGGRQGMLASQATTSSRSTAGVTAFCDYTFQRSISPATSLWVPSLNELRTTLKKWAASKRDSLISVGFKRVTARRPCRICGKPTYRGFSSDESTSICMRVSARQNAMYAIEECVRLQFGLET